MENMNFVCSFFAEKIFDEKFYNYYEKWGIEKIWIKKILGGLDRTRLHITHSLLTVNVHSSPLTFQDFIPTECLEILSILCPVVEKRFSVWQEENEAPGDLPYGSR